MNKHLSVQSMRILIQLANFSAGVGEINEKVTQPGAIYSVAYLIKNSFQDISAIIAVCFHVLTS
jgi:hypothetical protein